MHTDRIRCLQDVIKVDSSISFINQEIAPGYLVEIQVSTSFNLINGSFMKIIYTFVIYPKIRSLPFDNMIANVKYIKSFLYVDQI